MGQYYNLAIGNKNGKNVQIYTPLASKLMEISWFGQRKTPLFAAKEIYKNPSRIAFVGDYAEDDDIQELDLPPSVKRPDIKRIWGKEAPDAPEIEYLEFFDGDKFLVNHDKHKYLDMKKYIINNIQNMDCIHFYRYMQNHAIIHPLPLLTAIGNGRGGGDYFERYINAEKVGTWAWNLLSLENNPPKNYDEVEFCFIEQEQ